MAGRRRESILQGFYLEDVVPTGKTLGVGSYGAVVEVMISEILLQFCM